MEFRWIMRLHLLSLVPSLNEATKLARVLRAIQYIRFKYVAYHSKSVLIFTHLVNGLLTSNDRLNARCPSGIPSLDPLFHVCDNGWRLQGGQEEEHLQYLVWLRRRQADPETEIFVCANKMHRLGIRQLPEPCGRSGKTRFSNGIHTKEAILQLEPFRNSTTCLSECKRLGGKRASLTFQLS